MDKTPSEPDNSGVPPEGVPLGTVRPCDGGQVADIVSTAGAQGQTLRVVGGGSRARLGLAVRADKDLDMSALSGIHFYEPGELVMSAGAGTPLVDIVAALAEAGQHLAFEPPDWGALFAGACGRTTIGGVFATNASGSRRFQAGAARDHLLGFQAVNGRGERFVSGGRVIKNVSGYDLSKLLCGSFGTLAVFTEVTFKVLPHATGCATLLIPGLGDHAARAAMVALSSLSLPVTGLSYCPAESVDDTGPLAAGDSWLMVRVEAPQPVLSSQCRDVERVLEHPASLSLDGKESQTLWQWVACAGGLGMSAPPRSQEDQPALWKLHLPPTLWPDIVATLSTDAGVRYMCDWGGGLLWVELGDDDGGAARLRDVIAVDGGDDHKKGYGVLVRASEELRARSDVFQIPASPSPGLTKRIKRAFDPLGVLNPGRMYPDL